MLFLLSYLAARAMVTGLAATTIAYGALLPGKTYTSGSREKPTTSLSCPDWDKKPTD
jgi:hypothetical protein